MEWNTPESGVKKPEEGTPPSPSIKLPLPSIVFSDDAINNWLFDEDDMTSSNVCVGIYGHDGTAKTGIAMDCRTPEEVKAGMRIIVFDLDGGGIPLKVVYHNNDPNIIIRNPIVRGTDKNGKTVIDYDLTFEKINASLMYIQKNLKRINLKALIFDGLDKFLKICEYSMREELGKSVTDGVNYLYWKNRNQKYMDIVEQLKMIDVDRYFITHLKDKSPKDASGNIVGNKVIWAPDWQPKTNDMMFQKVKCYRETKVENGDKVTLLKGIIEKSKTNISLEGKEYVISKTVQKADGTAEAKWYGLRFSADNNIVQNN